MTAWTAIKDPCSATTGGEGHLDKAGSDGSGVIVEAYNAELITYTEAAGRECVCVKMVLDVSMYGERYVQDAIQMSVHRGCQPPIHRQCHHQSRRPNNTLNHCHTIISNILRTSQDRTRVLVLQASIISI